jgi:hypothetical protein
LHYRPSWILQGGLCMFKSSPSLLSTDAYFMQHKAFLKEWVDTKAFLEMV